MTLELFHSTRPCVQNWFRPFSRSAEGLESGSSALSAIKPLLPTQWNRIATKKRGRRGGGGNLVAYDITSLLWRKTDLDFLDSFIWLESNVGHTGVHHEAEEVENEVGMAAQVEEGGVALTPELLVAGLAIKIPPKKPNFFFFFFF